MQAPGDVARTFPRCRPFSLARRWHREQWGVGMAPVGTTTGRGKGAQSLTLPVRRQGRSSRGCMSAQNQARGSGLKAGPGHRRLCAGVGGSTRRPRQSAAMGGGAVRCERGCGADARAAAAAASEEPEPSKSDHELVSVERKGVGVGKSVPARGTAPATAGVGGGAGGTGRRWSPGQAGP